MVYDRRAYPKDFDRREPDEVRGTFWGDHPESLAPYVPTHLNVVHEMLRLAGTGPGDVVFDLGCGDGRILFSAVEEFDVDKAVGYDLSLDLLKSLKKKITDNAIEGRIKIHNANIMDADLSTATIVTLYLTTSGNAKLRPKLEKELKKGTRVVSHDFPVHGWVPDSIDGNPYTLGSHKMWLYRIPEAYQKGKKAQHTDEEERRWMQIRDAFTHREKDNQE
jgi:SAM-dependent methyltransferase